MAIPVDVQAALDALQKEKDADIAALKVEIENSVENTSSAPFVGYVLNNWETRPALLIGGNQTDGHDLVVFTKGEVDGAENAAGYVIHTGVKKNNTKHIPGTWHDTEL